MQSKTPGIPTCPTCSIPWELHVFRRPLHLNTKKVAGDIFLSTKATHYDDEGDGDDDDEEVDNGDVFGDEEEE